MAHWLRCLRRQSKNSTLNTNCLADSYGDQADTGADVDYDHDNDTDDANKWISVIKKRINSAVDGY